MIKEIESIKLPASPRAEVGSIRVKRLRRQGWLPCVVYDTQGQAQSLKINRHNFELLIRRHGSQNLILDLDIENGGARKVLLKEIQRDNIRDYAMHADFQVISMTRKLRVAVDITLVGEPVGVTQQGGILEHLLRTVEVECLPTDIVKTFPLNVNALDVGDSMFVRDLKLDPKFTLLTPENIAIVTIQLPPAEEEVKPEAEAAEAAEGPEVISKEEQEAAEAGEEGKEKEAESKEKPSTAKEKGKETKGKTKAKT